MSVKCADCGQYIPNSEMFSSDGRARFYYEPLSEFGPEVAEWICGNCVSGSRSESEDTRSLAEAEGRQSGGEAVTPNPSGDPS